MLYLGHLGDKDKAQLHRKVTTMGAESQNSEGKGKMFRSFMKWKVQKVRTRRSREGIQPKPLTYVGHPSVKSSKVIYWLSRFPPLLERIVLRLKCLQTETVGVCDHTQFLT